MPLTKLLKMRVCHSVVTNLSCLFVNMDHHIHQLLNVNLMKKKVTPGKECDDQKVPRGGAFGASFHQNVKFP